MDPVPAKVAWERTTVCKALGWDIAIQLGAKRVKSLGLTRARLDVYACK